MTMARWMAVAGICVILLEIAVRLALPQFSPAGDLQFFVHPDHGLPFGEPGRTFRHRKNTGDYDVTVRFNADGLRDARLIATAGPESWVVVGDSFAFGWGVESQDRFSDRLGNMTDREVFNLALPGSNIETYRKLLLWARDRGASPGLLIIAMSLENDLLLNPMADIGGRQGWSFPLGRIKRWFAGSSALYRATATAAHQTPWLERALVRLGLVQENEAGLGRLRPEMVDVAGTAAAVKSLCEDVQCVVGLIPSRALWVGPGQQAAAAIHDRVVAELDARGLEIVDPRAAMEATGEPLGFHFRRDGHWNAAGHGLFAELLAGAAPLVNF